MLPSYRAQQRTSFIPFPRTRLSWVVILLLGTVSLYAFYYLSPPDARWNLHHRPYPPPRTHPHPPPFDEALDEFEKVRKPLGHKVTPPPTSHDSAKSKSLWQSRAEDVKNSFLHAWNSYEAHAWGQDELRPLSIASVQNFNGWGVSIVDALDTLLLMNLRPQFDRAMEHVAAMNFTQAQFEHAPFFETTIRYVGGLLSAYALVVDDNLTNGLHWQPHTPSSSSQTSSSDIRMKQERHRIASILLSRAEHLARVLIPVFNTSSGLPAYGVNTVSGIQQSSYSALLAEIGSCQMEYKYLAHITGRREYFDIVNNITDNLEILQKKQMAFGNSSLGGMLPTKYSIYNGDPIDSTITVGALADSAYEYFLKGYLLTSRSEKRLLDMYLNSVDTALRNMTYISTSRQLVYISDISYDIPSYKMEHLSCFYPGLLSLGTALLNSKGDAKVELPPALKERHQWAAEAIAETCWVMYADNPTGLGSEEIVFDRPMVPQTTPQLQNSLKGQGGTSTQSDRVYYIPADVEHNRWWKVIDGWDKEGRPGDVAPGIQHDQRKLVVTNGGKASWDLYSQALPSDNETPYVPPPSVTEEEKGTRYSKSGSQRPIHLQTHLRDYKVRDGRWLMRPETIESFYLLFRATGDPVWRDRCYSVYLAMEKHSRTEVGYASVLDVDYKRREDQSLVEDRDPYGYGLGGQPLKEDSMPSYALAETFKYLYLCMMDPEESNKLLPPQSWIFNTEAHPLPVFEWTELEKKEWHIK